jgi:PPOX class probable F420-dependent enzyme
MARMTAAETRALLSEGAPTAKLAVVRKDGSPFVTPIWFVMDGDDLIFTTGADTVKGRTLLRDPRVSLCVDEERPPFAYVRMDGTASISEDPDELLRWATLLAGRYMGAEQAERFGRRNAVPGELLVRVRATRVRAVSGVAD